MGNKEGRKGMVQKTGKQIEKCTVKNIEKKESKSTQRETKEFKKDGKTKTVAILPVGREAMHWSTVGKRVNCLQELYRPRERERGSRVGGRWEEGGIA